MTDDRVVPERIGEVVEEQFVEAAGRWAFTPDYVVAPGETLKDWFEERAFGPRDRELLALRHGIKPSVLAGLLAGTEPITAPVAVRLQEMTGVGAMFWLALEHNFREGLAAGKSWGNRERGDDGAVQP